MLLEPPFTTKAISLSLDSTFHRRGLCGDHKWNVSKRQFDEPSAPSAHRNARAVADRRV
jgi:hypothetical protein